MGTTPQKKTVIVDTQIAEMSKVHGNQEGFFIILSVRRAIEASMANFLRNKTPNTCYFWLCSGRLFAKCFFYIQQSQQRWGREESLFSSVPFRCVDEGNAKEPADYRVSSTCDCSLSLTFLIAYSLLCYEIDILAWGTKLNKGWFLFVFWSINHLMYTS